MSVDQLTRDSIRLCQM